MHRKKTATYLVFGAVGVFPAEGDEADGDGIEEFCTVEAVRSPGHGIDVCRELDPLIEFAGADLRDQCSAEGEDDVAVLVGVLKYGIALVGIEFPAGGGDD